MLWPHRMHDGAAAVSGTKQGSSSPSLDIYPCFTARCHCRSVRFERSNGMDVERLISAVPTVQLSRMHLSSQAQ